MICAGNAQGGNMLDGYKTYICVILIIVVAILHFKHLIDNETRELLITILSASAGATMYSGIKRTPKIK